MSARELTFVTVSFTLLEISIACRYDYDIHYHNKNKRPFSNSDETQFSQKTQRFTVFKLKNEADLFAALPFLYRDPCFPCQAFFGISTIENNLNSL